MIETRTPLPHALCVHLCSKKLYMLDLEREVCLEDLHTAGYENYWCRHTATDTAHDGGWVTLEHCAPSRPCYEPMERSISLGQRVREGHPTEPGDWPSLEPAPAAAAEAEDLKGLSFTELLSRRTGQDL